MSKLIATHSIPSAYFVKQPMRSDLNFFAFDSEELKKGLIKYKGNYTPEVYEIEFWTKKPTFKKLTQARVNQLIKF